MRVNFRFLVVVVVLIFTAGYSFATIITSIQIDLDPVKWYFGDGDYFKVVEKVSGGDALLQTSIAMTEYSVPYFLIGTMKIDPVSTLTDDQTTENGGWAKGLFSAGARMTINGTLLDMTYNVVVSGDLIIADIVDPWVLKELESPPAAGNTVKGKAFYDVIGGALFDGSNIDGLILPDFWGDFSFKECPTDITDFETMTGAYECDQTTLQIDSIPEPCSLLLVSLGGLLGLRRRK